MEMDALNKLREATGFLKGFGIADAVREAELIIMHSLRIDKVALYRDNPQISDGLLTMIDEFLKRRSKREPLQYILGHVEFYELKIEVGQGVLIPRPETELLVEEAIKLFTVHSALGGSPFTVLDLCTGSGCLALALGKAFPDAHIYGTDISEVAIRYAKENAKINGINSVTFLRGSLFEPIKKLFTVHSALGGSPFTFDLIVSNPPYIKRSDIENLQPEVRDWEPSDALDGGEDGLDYYRAIIPEAKSYLKEGGYIMFEIGFGQADAVRKMAEDSDFIDISLIKDYAGIERILIAKRLLFL
jgi:release factor glutamine methyltransferase